MGWAPGARLTEADSAGDVKSLRRRLEDRLVLLVKGQGARTCPALTSARPVLACDYRCCMERHHETASRPWLAQLLATSASLQHRRHAGRRSLVLRGRRSLRY